MDNISYKFFDKYIKPTDNNLGFQVGQNVKFNCRYYVDNRLSPTTNYWIIKQNLKFEING
jgi:hypothetical protein